MPAASPVRRLAAAAVAIAVGGLCGTLLTGCSTGSDSGPDAPGTQAATGATDPGTPLADVDTTALAVRRAPFCDLVDPAAVRRALGRKAGDASAYRSGQRTRISAEVTDVVHEYGCRWTAGDVTARAWVFAPPVTRRRAESLVRDARAGVTCERRLDDTEFGRPSAACLTRGDDGVELSYRGLFGDAWLACALALPGDRQDALEDRAGRWCAAVVTAASSEG